MRIKNVEKKKEGIKQLKIFDQIFETIILIMEEKPNFVIPHYWYYIAMFLNTFQKSGYTFNTLQEKAITQENIRVIAQINEISTISYLISKNNNDMLTLISFHIMNFALIFLYIYIIILTILRHKQYYIKQFKQRAESINKILYIILTFYQQFIIVPLFEINIGIICCNENNFLVENQDDPQKCNDQPIYRFILAYFGIVLSFLLNFLAIYFTRSYEFQDSNRLRRKYSRVIIIIFLLQLAVMFIDFVFKDYQTLKFFLFHIQNLVTLYDILINFPFRSKIISALYNLQFSYCFVSTILIQIWLNVDTILEYELFYSFLPLTTLVFFTVFALQLQKYEQLTKFHYVTFKKQFIYININITQMDSSIQTLLLKYLHVSNYKIQETSIMLNNFVFCLKKIQKEIHPIFIYSDMQRNKSFNDFKKQAQYILNRNKFIKKNRNFQHFDFFLDELFHYSQEYTKNEESKAMFCDIINFHKNNCFNPECRCNSQNFCQDYLRVNFKNVSELIEDLFVWCLNQPQVIGDQKVFMNICIKYISFISISKNNSLKAYYHLQLYFHKLKYIDYYSQKISIVLAKNIQNLNELEIQKFQQKDKTNLDELSMSDTRNAEEYKELVIPTISSYLLKKKDLLFNLQQGYDHLETFAKDAKELSLNGIKVTENFQEKQQFHSFENTTMVIPMKVASIYHSFVTNNLRKAIDLDYEIKQVLKKELMQTDNMISNLNCVRGNNQNFQVSISDNKGSIVKKNLTVNQLFRLSQFFGYATQEFRKIENINDLIPSFISEFHTYLIDNAIETGNISSIFSQKHTFGKSKKNFLIPLRLKIQSCPTVINNFELIVSLLKKKQNQDYIVFNDMGSILGMTEKAYKSFFKHPIKKKYQKIQNHMKSANNTKSIKRLQKMAVNIYNFIYKLFQYFNQNQSCKIFQNHEINAIYKHFNLFLICSDLIDLVHPQNSLNVVQQRQQLIQLNQNSQQTQSMLSGTYKKIKLTMPLQILELQSKYKHKINEDSLKMIKEQKSFYINSKQFIYDNSLELDSKMCFPTIKVTVSISKNEFIFQKASKEMKRSYYIMEVGEFKLEKKRNHKKPDDNSQKMYDQLSPTQCIFQSTANFPSSSSAVGQNSSNSNQNEKKKKQFKGIEVQNFKIDNTFNQIINSSSSNSSESESNNTSQYQAKESSQESEQPNRFTHNSFNSMIDTNTFVGSQLASSLMDQQNMEKQQSMEILEEGKNTQGSLPNIHTTKRRLSKFADHATAFKSIELGLSTNRSQKFNFSLSNIIQDAEKDNGVSINTSRNNLLTVERASILLSPLQFQQNQNVLNLLASQYPRKQKKNQNSDNENQMEDNTPRNTQLTSPETDSQKKRKIKAKIRSSFRRAIWANNNKNNITAVKVQLEQHKIYQKEKQPFNSMQSQIDMEMQHKQRQLINQMENIEEKRSEKEEEEKTKDSKSTNSKNQPAQTAKVNNGDQKEEEAEENQYTTKKFDFELVQKYINSNSNQKKTLTSPYLVISLKILAFCILCVGYLLEILKFTSDVQSIIEYKNVAQNFNVLYSQQVSDILSFVFIKNLAYQQSIPDQFIKYSTFLQEQCHNNSQQFNDQNSEFIFHFTTQLNQQQEIQNDVYTFSNREQQISSYKTGDLLMLVSYHYLNVCYSEKDQSIKEIYMVDGYYILLKNINKLLSMSQKLYSKISTYLGEETDKLINIQIIFSVVSITIFTLLVLLSQKSIRDLSIFRQKTLLLISRITLNELDLEIQKIQDSLEKLQNQKDTWLAFDFVNLMISSKMRKETQKLSQIKEKGKKRKDIQASSLIFDQKLNNKVQILSSILFGLVSSTFFCGFVLKNYYEIKQMQSIFKNIEQTDNAIFFYCQTLTYSNILYSQRYLEKYEQEYPKMNLKDIYQQYNENLNNLKNFTSWVNKEQFNYDLSSSDVQSQVQRIIKENLCGSDSPILDQCKQIPETVKSYYTKGLQGILTQYFTYSKANDELLQNGQDKYEEYYEQLQNFYKDENYEVLFLNGFTIPLNAFQEVSSVLDNAFIDSIAQFKKSCLLYFIIGGISFAIIFTIFLFKIRNKIQVEIQTLKFSLTLIPHNKFQDEATIYMLKSLFQQ